MANLPLSSAYTLCIKIMAPHLLIAISYHGFGHIGQTAPIVHALKEKLPNLKITLLSSAPKAKLIERFGFDIDIIEKQMDVGMIQADALNVDTERSFAAYVQFHSNWDSKVKEIARLLKKLNVDLVLSNISYLALAGAKSANIPAIAYCSLNWAEIFNSYFSNSRKSELLFQQMMAAYNSAKLFLAPSPSMRMPGIKNRKNTNPIAQPGVNCRNKLLKRLGLSLKTRIILISVGGMDINAPVVDWPALPNTIMVVPDNWDTVARTDIFNFKKLEKSFIDTMHSCDLFVTKPGYGSFVEAAFCGVPVLYIERNNWPEQDILIQWLDNYTTCKKIELNEFISGDFLHNHDSINKANSTHIKPILGTYQVRDKILNTLLNNF